MDVLSLSVQSLLSLYKSLSSEDQIAFLNATGHVRKAALVSELNEHSVTGIVRELVMNDSWIRDEVIIDDETVPAVANQIHEVFRKAKFFYKKKVMAKCNDPEINDGKGIEMDTYVIVYFDPNNLTSLEMMYYSHSWRPPVGTEFEVFNIEKIDPTVQPLLWELYDENGLIYEIMPHWNHNQNISRKFQVEVLLQP
jgi:hypothetical protein